jgi:hypothetical protein
MRDRITSRRRNAACKRTAARSGMVFRLVTVLGFLLVSACSYRTPIEYRTIVAGAEDPLTTVKLETIDGRESDMAQIDARQIGSLRGLFGNAFPLFEAGPQSVPNVARDATADALRLARVGVYDRSPRTLVATLKKFWIDGYMGYKATVTVQCDLRDEQGNVLWTSVITGEGGGVNWAGPDTFVRATFQRALGVYVQKAGGEFSSPEFQRYVF